MRLIQILKCSFLVLVAMLAATSTAAATPPGKSGDLLYEMSDVATGSAVVAVPWIGGRPVRLTPKGGTEAIGRSARYSPDGRRIAFVGAGDQLWTGSSDSRGRVKELTFKPQFCDCYVEHPVFDSDGRSILYGLGDSQTDTSQLMEIPADGGKPRESGRWLHGYLSDISPNGRVIMSVDTGFAEGGEIYLFNRKTGSNTAVATHGLPAAAPSFSPDGSKIVFAGGVPGAEQIYSMATDGSNLTRLTTGGNTAKYPVFSPDGRKIAYLSTRDGVPAVFTMNTDGSNKTVVVANLNLTRVSDWQRSAAFFLKRINPKRKRLAVKLFGPGRLFLRGRGVKKSTVKVKGIGTKVVRLKLKRHLRTLLKRRGRVGTKLHVRFAPRGALSVSVSKRISLARSQSRHRPSRHPGRRVR